jgi:hypothetical protein
MAEMAACLDVLKVWQQNWLSVGSGFVAKIAAHAKVQRCAAPPHPGPGSSAERTNVAVGVGPQTTSSLSTSRD